MPVDGGRDRRTSDLTHNKCCAAAGEYRMLVLNLMGFTCPPLTSEARARIQAKPNGLDSLEAAGSPIRGGSPVPQGGPAPSLRHRRWEEALTPGISPAGAAAR